MYFVDFISVLIDKYDNIVLLNTRNKRSFDNLGVKIKI